MRNTQLENKINQTISSGYLMRRNYSNKINKLLLSATIFVAVLVYVLYLMCNSLVSQFLVIKGIFIWQADVDNHSQFLEENNYDEPNKMFATLSDIQTSSTNVFFVETSCATNRSAEHFKVNGRPVLTGRQCCAIESTARTNPDRKIYIFFSCALTNMSLQVLATVPGVSLVPLESRDILRDTPVQRLEQALEASLYPVEHSSDILRMVLLWKFGGTYLDLDVVTLRSLQPLGTDWLGMQDTGTIANGAMDVSPSGRGHTLMGRALEELARRYDPAGWATNGPGVLTPLVLDECGVDTVVRAVDSCQTLTVLDSSVLYPIPYWRWMDLFDPTIGPTVVDELERTAYSVHLWNKLSHGTMVRLDSSQGYALLATKYCPTTVATMDQF